jgi:hypothetical protein
MDNKIPLTPFRKQMKKEPKDIIKNILLIASLLFAITSILKLVSHQSNG